MKNTRRQKRYKVDSTNIRGTIIFASYLKINDISLGGISLTTEKRLTIGNEYALKLQGKDAQLLISAKVRLHGFHSRLSGHLFSSANPPECGSDSPRRESFCKTQKDCGQAAMTKINRIFHFSENLK
ncbi:MAG: PilZ domain-containing protein [Nitrospira sp.]|nr:PilZ domain-containing protein [Nitrospira sp.]